MRLLRVPSKIQPDRRRVTHERIGQLYLWDVQAGPDKRPAALLRDGIGRACFLRYYLMSQEDTRLTLQIGLNGSDGIVLASDTCMTKLTKPPANTAPQASFVGAMAPMSPPSPATSARISPPETFTML